MKDIKRKRLLKVLKIIRTTDESHPMNCNEISQVLYDNEGIISDRQAILADIKALKEDGYDIESCNYKRNGYYMASHLLEDWQLKILIDAINKAQFITSNVAKDIIDTLLATTSQGNSAAIASATPFLDESTNHNSPSKKILSIIRKGTQYNISALLEAILSDKRVSFNYCSISSDLEFVPRHNGRIYDVNPYLLYWDQDYYYLCASECTDSKKLKTYRLDKIDNLNIKEEPLESCEKVFGPSYNQLLKDHVNNSIHHFGGEKRILLKVKVPPFMVDYLFDEFGESLISVETYADAKLATIHAYNSPGLRYLLLQYSENLEIVSPADFREDFKRTLTDILRKYQ